jgi:glutamate dehydrogenase
LIVLQLFDIPSLWREIEALDGVAPAHVQLDAMNEIIALITREVTWFLKRSAHKPDLKIDIAFFDQRLKDLFALLPNVLNHYGQDLFERRKKEWLAQEGMTESVAQRLSLFYILGAGCDIVKLADRCHAPLDEIAISYFAIGQQFMLGLLRQCGRNMDMSSRWEREAIENLIDDLYQIQAELTETSRTFEQDHMPWKEYYAHHIQEVMNIITEIKSSPAIDLPMLLIAQQQLRGLIK